MCIKKLDDWKNVFMINTSLLKESRPNFYFSLVESHDKKLNFEVSSLSKEVQEISEELETNYDPIFIKVSVSKIKFIDLLCFLQIIIIIFMGLTNYKKYSSQFVAGNLNLKINRRLVAIGELHELSFNICDFNILRLWRSNYSSKVYMA